MEDLITFLRGRLREIELAIGDYFEGWLALPFAGHPDYREAWRP